MTGVILFVFGATVGSFLNVVASRWGSGKGLGGRSECPHCGAQLRWFELIPLVSFLIQNRKCRNCRGEISWQYPLVEVLTGLIFISVPPLALPVFCIYLVIGVYDLHTKIIPDVLVYASIILAFAIRFLISGTLIDWLAGPILLLFFASVWLLSGGRAMGLGDAKLGLSIGLLIGAALGFSAIILAFWIGAVFALTYMGLNKLGFLSNHKEITLKSEVPFAPFMILGAWASVILDLDLLHVSLL